MAKVLISDKLSTAAVDILKRVPGVDVDFRPGLGKDKAELLKALSNADALAVRSETKVTSSLVSLMISILLSAGLNLIPTAHLTIFIIGGIVGIASLVMNEK